MALVRERCADYAAEVRPRDQNALVRAMEEQLHAQLLAAVDGGTIEQENYSSSETDGRIMVTLRARCSEDIAKERKK